MADDTNTAEREAFKAAHQHLDLVERPDAWGRPVFRASHVEASWRGWLARASLAASAGSEPVAWMVPHLHTFKGATKVHFTRAPGCTMTDAELMDDLEGRVMWLPSTFSDSPGVTDKFGVHHKPKPLYAHPSPPEGMAGWISVDERLPSVIERCDWLMPITEIKRERWILSGECIASASVPGKATHWRKALPLPASEAKEL